MGEREAVIGRGVVRIHCRALGSVIQDEALQSLRIGVPYHLRRNLITSPILCAHNGNLPNRTAPSVL